MTNYIALAVPFFFVFIGLEVWIAKKRGVRTYRMTDSMIDLACGTTQQLVLIFLAGGLVGIYSWVYTHYRFITFASDSPWPWVIAFVLIDFKYYWWHRLSHEVNFLWAAHVTHHQSEDYNLAVALRQSVTSALTALPFGLPLAFLGVPVIAFATMESFSTLYQFWIHTELVGKLGWFERIFNTPAQHRVHHAVNPQYLDKNYAATLCIWDRLFGTFEEEIEPPVFGLVKPLSSFNPLWAQFHYYIEIAQMAWAAPLFSDKLRAFVKGPPWRPRGLPQCPPPPQVTPQTARKYDPKLRPGLRGYLWVQLVATMGLSFLLMLFQYTLETRWLVGGVSLVLLTLLSWGALIERRSWAVPLELARLFLLGVGLAVALRARMALPLPALFGIALLVVVPMGALLLRGNRDPSTAQLA